MTPQIHNFSIYQGSTDALSLVWNRDGAAVDLTGYTARMQLRHSANSETVVTELSSANGKIVLTALGGITVHFSAADSAALAPYRYAYDLDLTTGSDTRTILAGTVTVTREVTR